MLHLPRRGLEQAAIEAGEIDAIIDHANRNVILLPAARRALLARASGGNALLAALPDAELWRLRAGLERVALKFGEVLHEPGAPIQHVYFPAGCVVSLLSEVAGRQALQVGLVGNEGMVGVSLALGVDVSSIRSLVQAPGMALRMNGAHFREACRQCASLRRDLCAYANAKLALARQSAACQCFHAVQARLARCLLMSSDRSGSKQFFLTQSFLAGALGVRRATVNEAAGPLQQRKLIAYTRGKITILDRESLEAASCSCYTRIDRGRDPA